MKTLENTANALDRKNGWLKNKNMIAIKSKTPFPARMLIFVFIALHLSSCYGQVNVNEGKVENTQENQVPALKQHTIFPQIHSNLNGMVREFVRAMYQDTKGNYWFGTNGNGIIRYDGQTLETITIEGTNPYMRVMEIVEDKAGNVWFGTSDGLLKYDGEKFTTFSKKEGLQGEEEEIWGLTIDKSGLIWVGATGGLSHFDGEQFISLPLPDSMVENPQHMLSDQLVFKIVEDKSGTIWLATDGNGIFKYSKGAFTHLSNKNGLTDNNAADILADKHGNIWIGTFYGGISKFDGKTYTNFTKDGIVKGEETGGLYEDSKGNIWFTAENVGVYKYDGTNFTLYTTENGLTSNLVLSIFEDNKGQLWFGTWQGICIYDGGQFMNAIEKEPWVK
ncbi:MAG TPA: two-component regulator propeller domain-containing protein [Saprospiraceae bacterium]|nr:two-component regulator propeller domain-containing protein [Saprospiraceae bacterium]HMQ85784.1 two-component regulator propeller domain-containing protein [Saprospiraceae bacterium]